MAKAFKRFLSWNYKIKKSSGISRAVQAQGKKKHCLVLAVSYKLAKGTGIEEADDCMAAEPQNNIISLFCRAR